MLNGGTLLLASGLQQLKEPEHTASWLCIEDVLFHFMWRE